MFLRNYYNAMALLNMGSYLNKPGTWGDGYLNIRSEEGRYMYDLSISYFVLPFTEIQYCGYRDASSSVPYILFGSGSTPVDFEDYKLATTIESKFTGTKVSVGNPVYDSESRKYTVIVKYTLSNKSSEEVTVREYGIFNRISGYYCLYFRDLITPYTMSPSESVNVVLTYSYTMPTIDESGNVVAGTQAYGLNIE